MSKYLELKNELKKIINSLDPHDKLPSHHIIMDRFGVSDITVRKALVELDKEGLIYTHQGKGRFVSPQVKFYPEIYCIFDSLDTSELTIGDSADLIFPTLVDLLSIELMNSDFEMLLSLYKDSLEYDRQILQRLPEKKPEGVIYLYSGIEENLKYYENVVDIIPNSVFIDRKIEGINASFVGTDNKKATMEMVETIKDEYFDQVIIVSNNHRNISVCSERANGYLNALLQTRHKNRILTLINENFVLDYGIKISKELLNSLNKYNKVCICYDNSYLFRQFYRSHKKELMHVDYLKVLCFDVPLKGALKNISFTYAKQDLPKIAKETVRILKEKKLNNEEIRVPAKIKFL